MPYVAQLYFKTAIILLIIGVIVGLQMSISGTHNVTGAHAHANLLGWVTMALFGTYFALMPEKAQSRVAIVQYGIYTVGVIVMIPSLYFMLSGNPAFEPLVAAGSMIVFAGVLLFAFMVFSREPASRAHDAVART